jgi:hypothetical protein
MKKNTIQVLSFLSGLTIAAVAVGVTVSKNQSIRNEIENQLNNILGITKPLLSTLKGFIANANNANSAYIKADAQGATAVPDLPAGDLSAQWEQIESATR